MQKQIQGTDELQMWTGFTGFKQPLQSLSGHRGFFLGGQVCAHAHAFVSLWVLFVLNTSGLSEGNWNSREQLLHATIKKNSQQSFGLLYTIYKKTKQMKMIILISNP